MKTIKKRFLKKDSYTLKKKSFGFAVGRRKSSFSQIIIFPGTGYYQINSKIAKLYFQNNQDYFIKSFFSLIFLNIFSNFNILIKVNGGGLETQTQAISLAVSRAISKLFPSLKKILKLFKFLFYDSRIIESKKYGLRKARKAPQYRKR